MRRTLHLLSLLVSLFLVGAALAACGTADSDRTPEVQSAPVETSSPPDTGASADAESSGGNTSASAPSSGTSPTVPTGEAAANDPTPSPPPVKLPKLPKDGRNAIAFAPLSDPSDVTVVGSVNSTRAWSTSKVLVVAAYIKTVAGGDPDNLSPYWRGEIKKALTASDMNSLLRIRGAIPGGSGRPMTEILRSIGDNNTTAPNSSEGSMSWGIRDQLKFISALDQGKVVNKATSRYILNTMHPIPEHRWGLGTVGADTFKGGWLTPTSETRQMGILDGYAVVIITNGDGPAVLQSDGDYAHVEQMNKLARILNKYLAAEN